VHSPSFVQMIKDALSQLWGGPKLSQSPLLRLRLVREALHQHDGVPTKTLRNILRTAVDKQKPSGERSMTGNDWIVYNILDLRFVQNERIRDIARRMALSESDYYRKQRAAIQQVADTVARMETNLAAEGSVASDEHQEGD